MAADGMAFIRRLWQDWSLGFDTADCLEHVRESLADPPMAASASIWSAPPDTTSPLIPR